MIRAAVLLVCLVLAPLAGAVDSGQRFEDPRQQARYERIIRDLRCPMCRSESIADSNAIVAADLRQQVESLIREGRSDDEIYVFMTERYGDFILLKPPVAPRTWLLWAAPALFLAGGFATVLVVIRRRARIARSNPTALEEEPEDPT